ncbi:spore coat putative kinase YutH [Bacillus pinisoli]|uniref:spore coat putative kinase YutH n=1 Tax=Bacillus pinisoli TaxID=2901866 RepID=UPI001FF3E586|nr:spore coat protein YutH [Bacillus pinisoli]
MYQQLQSLYQLNGQRAGTYRSYDIVKTQEASYLLVPISHLDGQEIEEMAQLAEYFIHKGDQQVAGILKNKRGEVVSKAEDTLFVLLKCPYELSTNRNSSLGVELAKFHRRGKRIPFALNSLVRIGQWKTLWEKRLDQLEQFWAMKVKNQPSDEFDRLFAESFPYYVGLTENAIQYLVDTELDEQPTSLDAGTVCHHRFFNNCWDFTQFMKLPTDWVYDHPSRDLVEWARSCYWNKQRSMDKFHQMMNEYESINPLSAFSWRLFYARLLFPVHYFECIEGYYKTGDEEVKAERLHELQVMLKESDAYEKYSHDIHFYIGYRSKRNNVPKLHWIS